MKQINLAIEDIRRAGNQHRIWLSLGLLEVKQRYRRSVLGPWWISISMLIFIAAMGKIFSTIFAQNIADYVPFFTAGFLLWSFITGSIAESTELFRANASFIKQIKLPYNLYVLKFLTRNLIFFAHNFVVYLLVLWFFKLNPGLNVLMAIPGLLLLTINLYWICLVVALISTRFRDMVPIINSCLQILFFVTPISWMPKLLGENSIVVKLNPFVYFLDLVRQPLLGSLPTPTTWIVASCFALVGSWISLNIFSRARARIPFWID
ncbi:MAG: ABC transporter permease [Chlamydiales bacterium]|nr:ABC transporter permease [Chlamydiales bacterium]